MSYEPTEADKVNLTYRGKSYELPLPNSVWLNETTEEICFTCRADAYEWLAALREIANG